MNRYGMLILGLLIAPRVGEAQEPDFRWSGRLSAGQAIEIKGINGDIEAALGAGNQVEVTATKTARRSDPEDVEIAVVEHADGVTICAVYPTPSGKRPNQCVAGSGGRMNSEDNDVVVDFVIRVPAGVDFVGHTVNGDVEASGLRSNVEARTVNGGVEVVTTGIAEATSVNGGVDVTMGSVDWNGTLHLTTVNGELSVTLPAGADVDVSGSTVNGDIDTDFPITVQGRWGPRYMSGTIGDGGRSLELETVNGGIEIHRAE